MTSWPATPVVRRAGAPLWLVVVLAVIVPPVGLVLIWWRRGPAHAGKIIGTVVTGSWTVIWLIAVIGSSTGSGATKSRAAAVPVAVTTTAEAASAPSSSASAVPLPPPAPASSATTTQALETLGSLDVKGRAPQTGYSRDQFGQEWADVDRNGCDTRNDVLRRDLTAATIKPGTNGCVVLNGTLLDPYSGDSIAFTRGAASSDIEIDHVVALSDAWQTGAQQLDSVTRTALANDPANLLAVRGTLNTQKSDSDAASWLPPNTAFRCRYVSLQIAVKAKYGLWVTPAEKAAMTQILGACSGAPVATAAPPSTGPSAPAPASSPTAAIPSTTAAAPPVAPAPAASAPPAAPAPAEVVYKNCAAAKAAGAAPLYRGQPGYRPELDRDNDGVACET